MSLKLLKNQKKKSFHKKIESIIINIQEDFRRTDLELFIEILNFCSFFLNAKKNFLILIFVWSVRMDVL